MQSLKLLVGSKAQEIIRRNGGLFSDQVRLVLGASGGPKWLILRGLDDYIFGDWLLKSRTPKDLLGTSIGSMRMTAACTDDPKETFNDLLRVYCEMKYYKEQTYHDWTASAYDFFKEIFTDSRRKAIANGKDRRLNIIATRCRGLAGHPTSLFLNIVGLTKAYAQNLVDRKHLSKTFDRVIYSIEESGLPLDHLQEFNMLQGRIVSDNVVDILMASGSIPGVWESVVDIPHGPKGTMRDGGITDYHFDNKWVLGEDEVVLYPHFYQHIVPGWFDKKLKRRRMSGSNWDNVVMLAPSDELVASLPGGKITDRTDFTAYSNDQRLKVWNHVIDAGYRMADEFQNLVENSECLIDRMELPT
ncbi:hypothetical protein QGN29_10375 [Temperatibacter marinus]|uniref:Patatin-like phospholipase n=1 Tax=Temperatibacter marinus TaxID=1456591 RepID=A0AA52EF54_9PROT|nr:hypothetical protein [Temperatibacter marinus]WND01953.1 hypothetical protein QGN29_10375 [Temperatibacter marinus]